MRDIVKIILYVVFAIILTIATAAVVFIAYELILTNHIISAIVVIAVVGTITGYLLAKRK